MKYQVHKIRGISLLVEEVSACLEELCSMELVAWLVGWVVGRLVS
jgi:hypothetical protein